MILTVTSTVWVSAPPLPNTLSVKLPNVALPPAVTLRMEVAVPPGSGVTELDSTNVVSSGAALSQEVNSRTGELNPFSETTVMVAAPLVPGLIEIRFEDALMAKSDTATGVTMTVRMILWNNVPLLPTMMTP